MNYGMTKGQSPGPEDSPQKLCSIFLWYDKYLCENVAKNIKITWSSSLRFKCYSKQKELNIMMIFQLLTSYCSNFQDIFKVRKSHTFQPLKFKIICILFNTNVNVHFNSRCETPLWTVDLLSWSVWRSINSW